MQTTKGFINYSKLLSKVYPKTVIFQIIPF